MGKIFRIPAAFLILVFLTIALFKVNSYPRQQLFDECPGFADGSWRSLSGYSTIFLKRWYRAGAIQSDMELQIGPFQQINKSDRAYVSYPAGFLLPLHWWSLLRGEEPDLEFVMRASHWLLLLMALVGGGITLLCALKSPFPLWLSPLLGLASASVILFSPATSIYYPAAWWPDTVAPLYLLVLVAYEVFARDRLWKWGAKLAASAECALFLAACYSDWLPFLVLFIAGICRWRDGLPASRFGALVIAPSLVIALHLAQALKLDRWPAFLDKVSQRIGAEPTPANEALNIIPWQTIWENFFGAHTFWLKLVFGAILLGLWVWRLRRRKVPPAVSFLLLLTTPCFLHNLILLQHYQMHPYNIVKWGVVLAIAPAALLITRQRSLASIAAILMLVSAIASYQKRPNPNAAAMNSERWQCEACKLIARHQSFDDVFFSPNLDTEKMYYLGPVCYFPVFRATSPADVRNQLRQLQGQDSNNLSGKLFFSEVPGQEWNTLISKQPIGRTPSGGALYEWMDGQTGQEN